MPDHIDGDTEPLDPVELEYFQHNDETRTCVVSAVVWRDNIAYCPTCNQPGEVYCGTALDEVFRENDLSIQTFYCAQDGFQRVFIGKDTGMVDFALSEIEGLINALRLIKPIDDLEHYFIKVREYEGVAGDAQPGASPQGKE